MEGQTKVLWDFLETAYRTGALDELMLLSKAGTDKKYENQARVFVDLEEGICEMDDFSSVDAVVEEALRQLPALTDDETVEGIAILASVLRPLVDSVMESADRDADALTAKREEVLAALPKVGKALLALITANGPTLLAALGERSAGDYGREAGKSMNALASWINGIHERDPEAISDFMAGAFSAIDGDEVGKMADVLTGAFLDQRPPVLQWTAATMAGRAKKRVLGK